MKKSASFTAGIIGAGRVGLYHTRGQVALGSRVLLYDPQFERAEALAREFDSVTVAKSLQEVIAGADVLHICTPPMYHVETSLECIANHKPTIIEKPLAFTLEDAVTIYKAALDAQNTPVILATSFRTGPSPSAIYAAIRSGVVGEIGSLETSYVHDTKNLEPGKTWRKQLEGPAFLYEGGTHAVDLNMWLADQSVVAVQASVSGKKTRPEYRWDEDFAINLKYKDGMIGRVWVSAAAPLPKHGSGLAVYGENGAYRAHSKAAFYESYKDGDDAWERHPINVDLTMKTMQLMSEVFNDYIAGKRSDFKPMPDIKDGLKVMIVLNTIEKALKSGCTEKVPTIEDVLAD